MIFVFFNELCLVTLVLSVICAFCMTEEKSPVCFYNTSQAEEENDG